VANLRVRGAVHVGPGGHSPDQRELIVSGDRLAPYYNERPFFDKPILFHWLIWRGQPSLARFVA
jgi:hypothetical protein